MTTLHLLKFIHLCLGTFLLGGSLVSGIFVYRAYRSGNNERFKTALRYSLIWDGVFYFVLLNVALTGTLLVPHTSFNYHTPWIDAAYLFIGVLLVLWLSASYIKYRNLRFTTPQFSGRWVFILIQLSIALILIFIIHDAVLKQTFL